MSQPSCQLIEGPVMHWTVDDSLCVRFQAWKLKCDNILEAEFARCKKIQDSF